MSTYTIQNDDDIQCQCCSCDFRDGQRVKQVVRTRRREDGRGVECREEFYCLICAERYTYPCSSCSGVYNCLDDPSTMSFTGQKYCSFCAETRLSRCYFCDHMVDSYYAPTIPGSCRGENRSCCPNCWEDRYYHCPRCENIVDANNVTEYRWRDELTNLCNNCHYEETALRGGNKHFRTGKVDLSSNTFKHLRFNRCFGIELEVDCEDVPFTNIRDNTAFGSKYDGSIGDLGSEFYSPILQGDIGYREIKKICDLVKEFKISKNTGYHLHLDARDLKESQAKKIWLIYNLFEGVLFSMLPKSRKSNHYCQPSFVKSKRIADSHSLREDWYLQQKDDSEDWGDHYNSTRYFGFNLHSYYFQETIEVRYHSGTVNFNRVINWIKINQYIFKYALDHSTEEILKLKNFGDCKTNYSRIRRLFRKVVPNKSLWKYYKKRFGKFNDGFDKQYGWYKEIPEELREQRKKELDKRVLDIENQRFLNQTYRQEYLQELPSFVDVLREHHSVNRNGERDEEETHIDSNWRNEFDRARAGIEEGAGLEGEIVTIGSRSLPLRELGITSRDPCEVSTRFDEIL